MRLQEFKTVFRILISPPSLEKRADGSTAFSFLSDYSYIIRKRIMHLVIKNIFFAKKNTLSCIILHEKFSIPIRYIRRFRLELLADFLTLVPAQAHQIK